MTLDANDEFDLFWPSALDRTKQCDKTLIKNRIVEPIEAISSKTLHELRFRGTRSLMRHVGAVKKVFGNLYVGEIEKIKYFTLSESFCVNDGVCDSCGKRFILRENSLCEECDRFLHKNTAQRNFDDLRSYLDRNDVDLMSYY